MHTQIIYKYPLKLVEVQQIKIPATVHPIRIGLDGTNSLCLWANHFKEDLQSSYTTTIYIVGTGFEFEIPEEAEFIGTVTQATFVWHVFAIHKS